MTGRRISGGMLAFGLMASLLALPAAAEQVGPGDLVGHAGGDQPLQAFLQSTAELRADAGDAGDRGGLLPINPRADLRLPDRDDLIAGLRGATDDRSITAQLPVGGSGSAAAEEEQVVVEDEPSSGYYSFASPFTDVDGDGVDELLVGDVPIGDDTDELTLHAVVAATGETLWSTETSQFGYPISDDTDVDGDGVLDLMTIDVSDVQREESDCEYIEEWEEEYCATSETSFTTHLTLRSAGDFSAIWSVAFPSSYRYSYDHDSGEESYADAGVVTLVALRPGEVIIERATGSGSYAYEYESQIPSVRRTTTERGEAHDLRETLRLSPADGQVMSTSTLEVDGFIGTRVDDDLGIFRDVSVMPAYERTCTWTILLGTECDGEGGPTGSSLELIRWDGSGWTVESDADFVSGRSLGQDLVGGPADEVVLREWPDFWYSPDDERQVTVLGGDTGARTAATFTGEVILDALPSLDGAGPRLLSSENDWQQGVVTLTRHAADMVTPDGTHTYTSEEYSEDGDSSVYRYAYDVVDAREGGCAIVILTRTMHESEAAADYSTAYDSLRCDLTPRWSDTEVEGSPSTQVRDVAGTPTGELLLSEGGWHDDEPFTMTLLGGETGQMQWTHTIDTSLYSYGFVVDRDQVLAVHDHKDDGRFSTIVEMRDATGDVVWTRTSP